jgi:hypothetical protein
MSQIEIYSSLSHHDAIDVTGSNIGDPRLWSLHRHMVPLLRVLDVKHLSYENPVSDKLLLRQGQLVVHHELVDDFTELFEGWLDLKYPIEHAIPISQSSRSNDKLSMGLNRTLVYRPDVVGDPRDEAAPPSEHYYGRALDVNPLDNPLINPDHTVEPEEAIGRLPRLGMVLLRRPDVVQHALNLGFEWGNDWPDPRSGEGYYGVRENGEPRHILRDSHHFEVIPRFAKLLEMPQL